MLHVHTICGSNYVVWLTLCTHVHKRPDDPLNRNLGTQKVLYIYLLYGVTTKSKSGTCDPVLSRRSTVYNPRSFLVVLSRTKMSKKFGNSCRSTLNGCPCVRVKGFPFLCQSICRYAPDTLVSMTSFSGGSRTMTWGEILSSITSPVNNTTSITTQVQRKISCVF